MSRLISDSYMLKICKLINSHSIPVNLVNTIDFFYNEVKNDFISSSNRNRKIFSEIDFKKVSEIKNSKRLKALFSYLNILIKAFDGMYLHIHINEEITELNTKCIETLFYWDVINRDSFDFNTLDEDLKNLVIKSNLPIELSSGNNGHDENRLRRERKGIKHKIKIFKLLLNSNQVVNEVGTLLNINKASIDSVFISEFSELPSSLNTYINFGDAIQSIYNKNNSILSRVHTIINLFPSITGLNIWYKDFIAESVIEWNKLDEINFKKVITITSGEKNPESLSEMLKLNKFQAEEIYIINPFELNYDYEN